MYLSAPAKQLSVANFLALPLTSRPLFVHPLYFLPAVFSIIFCLIALFEVIHIVWNHFHPSKDWE